MKSKYEINRGNPENEYAFLLLFESKLKTFLELNSNKSNLSSIGIELYNEYREWIDKNQSFYIELDGKHGWSKR